MINASNVLETLGAKLKEIGIPEVKRTPEWLSSIILTDPASFHRDRIASHRERFGPEIYERLMLGYSTRGIDYAHSVERGLWWRRELSRIFQDVDLISTPTVPVPAPFISESEKMIETTKTVTRFTFARTLGGVPALSIPCGFTSDKMPIGLQIAAGWWKEGNY